MLFAAIWPYIELARFHRPTGAWLLMLPCYWGVALAKLPFFPSLRAYLLMTVGAFAMRGAGCALNDWADRHIDPYVSRTCMRPLARGALAPWQALLVFMLNTAVGFIVWFYLPLMAKIFSLFALGLAIAYPFSKRFTTWPQVILGLAFNSGVLIAWAAFKPALVLLPVACLLYISGVCWTIAYDTIYAIPDMRYDKELHIGSATLVLGKGHLKKGALGFYVASLMLVYAAGMVAQFTEIYYVIVSLAFCWIGWRLYSLDIYDEQQCLQRFQDNVWVGWAIFFAIVLENL